MKWEIQSHVPHPGQELRGSQSQRGHQTLPIGQQSPICELQNVVAIRRKQTMQEVQVPINKCYVGPYDQGSYRRTKLYAYIKHYKSMHGLCKLATCPTHSHPYICM